MLSKNQARDLNRAIKDLVNAEVDWSWKGNLTLQSAKEELAKNLKKTRENLKGMLAALQVEPAEAPQPTPVKFPRKGKKDIDLWPVVVIDKKTNYRTVALWEKETIKMIAQTHREHHARMTTEQFFRDVVLGNYGGPFIGTTTQRTKEPNAKAETQFAICAQNDAPCGLKEFVVASTLEELRSKFVAHNLYAYTVKELAEKHFNTLHGRKD